MWLSRRSSTVMASPDDLALVVAEQRLGGAVERQDPPGLVENDDAVGRRVEDGFKFMDAAVAKAEVRFHCSQTLQTVALRQASYDNEFCIDAVPRDGAALQLDRHLLVLAGRQRRAIWMKADWIRRGAADRPPLQDARDRRSR